MMDSPNGNQVCSPNPFLRAWAWKREHRPDRDRFHRPYGYKLKTGGLLHDLVIHQSPFKNTGFASTVWDSAIVLSKYLEKWPHIVGEKDCIELGAGCGLPGIVAAYLGASSVRLTDFPENLDLLQRNVIANKMQKTVSVIPLVWGNRSELLSGPFDLVIATDVMYCVEVVDSLLNTFKMLSGPDTIILLAYGRNRQAEQAFLEKARFNFLIKQVSNEELDDVYQCIDVDVLELRLKNSILS
ncbi:uncharacterized protein LOC131036885 [Cryptomeria japonica]|uniref:uncharacterized protein LOC131036885 n=1 Tax=Cryptomeria japonica TaxID=3369 RepID=UPI0027D9E0F1|nr:uncharacterized protein LOC131036885 [Cryptomeria japonica]